MSAALRVFRSKIRNRAEVYIERAEARLAQLRQLRGALILDGFNEFEAYWQNALDSVLRMTPMQQAERFGVEPPGGYVHDCLACRGKGWLLAEEPYGSAGIRVTCDVCDGLGVVE